MDATKFKNKMLDSGKKFFAFASAVLSGKMKMLNYVKL